jgi:hypothetical protein
MRKTIQDLLAPQLNSITAKLEAITAASEVRHNELLAGMEAMESKIGTAAQSAQSQYEAIMKVLDERRERMNSPSGVKG